MNFLSRIFYSYRRAAKAIKLFILIAGPGIIVMVADNDAGGITTYAVTGSQYGYNLIWFLLLLLPVAYIVQEMTVRLGAVSAGTPRPFSTRTAPSGAGFHSSTLGSWTSSR
jgi:Mn2+/Fe2+ NRAMP family transporter